METFSPGDGRAQAIRDWDARQARILAVGTPPSDVPMYDRTRNLFYSGGFGCPLSSAEELYCREYNRTVGWLLEKYGVPDWAPVKRLPTAVALLEQLKKAGDSFSTYSAGSPEETSVLEFVLYYWKNRRPVLWTRLQQSCLLVCGGNVTDQLGRVDVIDSSNDVKWMAFYQYPREEYPVLPWDISGQPEEAQQPGIGSPARSFIAS
jgi:hypothetical protein